MDQNKQELIKKIEHLNLPDYIIITSASSIKVETVKKTFKQLFPNREFNIIGVKANSSINEQPVGDETKQGALNRIIDAERIKKEEGYITPSTFISIENGIFKTNDGKYEDKAVVVIKLSNGQIFSEISSRGVIFPTEAVEATIRKEGGFKDHTVGSTIAEIFAEKGIIINKQDPHSALTSGEFSREDQITSTIEELFERIPNN
ncbi:MAG: DUF84 family protein [Candidatus Paceibacterota bacterium]|jgi:non-canonical (house-cleaning) NTP pyrophosphatase